MVIKSFGPARIRIVGDVDDLGYGEDGLLDPQFGLDLCWEDDRWKSIVLSVKPCSKIHFYVVRLDQKESHPGKL